MRSRALGPGEGEGGASAMDSLGSRLAFRSWPEQEERYAAGPGLESGERSFPGRGAKEAAAAEEEEEAAAAAEEAAAGGRPPGRAAVQVKVARFRKLGYSPAEIEGVLQKHGSGADTNTILGELVRHGGAVEKGGPERAPEAPETPLRPGPGSPARALGAPPGGGPEGGELRPIVVDGSNVAMSHGDKDVFSCRGILLAVNWFLERGHTDITVFVPSWRKEQPKPNAPISDQDILLDLERRKILVFTPSRRVGGKRVVCYDDRFIIKLAYDSDGIVVSNDTYRDLQTERLEWKKFIEERLLMYSFVNDKFMPPDDPLGRHGPSLDNFLRKRPLAPEHKKQQCPYGKKCTYGAKCRYYHPERLYQVQRSVADELRANAKPTPAPEERTSRCPPQGESVGPGDSEMLPLQKGPPAEKRGSTQKGKLADRAPHPDGTAPLSGTKKGGSSHYQPADWYQLPPASPCMDSLTYVSQDRLDSGIGSLESQLSEMWPGPSGGPSHYSHQDPLGVSSYRGVEPSYQHSSGLESGNYPLYPPQGYRRPLPASSASFLPYGPEVSPGQAPLPHAFSRYAMSPDPSLAPGQKYWSEPAYQPAPKTCRDLPRAPQAYGNSPSSCPWPVPERLAEERANVHVKLCGIFHPHLVDAVMSRFPHLLDPQQLAAEILTYKSQNPRM